MNKLNAAVVAGVFALAAVAGTVALTRTTQLGAAQRQSAEATVRARTRQLDRFQAALRRSLAKKPPALPAAPRPASSAGRVGPATAAAAPRVVYRRPPPIVVVEHLHHGDDGGFESGDRGEGGDA